MVRVLNTGFYSSIQDIGRLGAQHHGVPISGVMDQRATRLANVLVGNSEEAAVLEITMSGPKLKFECNSAIAITGADMAPSLNGKSLDYNRFIIINKGDVLSFGRLNSGFRSYLSVIGGFQTKEVLGSKSMYKGVTQFACINKEDVLRINQNNPKYQKHFSGLKMNDSYIKNSNLDVYKAPEFENLTEVQKDKLFSELFTISKDNSRMAYQLEEALENTLEPIITSPVLPGTVQLTPSGKLIILMRDCQTTGGYPRVLQLTESAINTLAQKYTGSKVCFKLKD